MYKQKLLSRYKKKRSKKNSKVKSSESISVNHIQHTILGKVFTTTNHNNNNNNKPKQQQQQPYKKSCGNSHMG